MAAPEDVADDLDALSSRLSAALAGPPPGASPDVDLPDVLSGEDDDDDDAAEAEEEAADDDDAAEAGDDDAEDDMEAKTEQILGDFRQYTEGLGLAVDGGDEDRGTGGKDDADEAGAQRRAKSEGVGDGNAKKAAKGDKKKKKRGQRSSMGAETDEAKGRARDFEKAKLLEAMSWQRGEGEMQREWRYPDDDGDVTAGAGARDGHALGTTPKRVSVRDIFPSPPTGWTSRSRQRRRRRVLAIVALVVALCLGASAAVNRLGAHYDEVSAAASASEEEGEAAPATAAGEAAGGNAAPSSADRGKEWGLGLSLASAGAAAGDEGRTVAATEAGSGVKRGAAIGLLVGGLATGVVLGYAATNGETGETGAPAGGGSGMSEEESVRNEVFSII